VRLYEHLFTPENPAAALGEGAFTDLLNPDSLRVLEGCRVEPSLAGSAPERRFQFMRKGYFCADRREWRPERMVFNRTVTLRDTWAKVKKKG
jgi:glutaminyl-tRNA synthetase